MSKLDPGQAAVYDKIKKAVDSLDPHAGSVKVNLHAMICERLSQEEAKAEIIELKLVDAADTELATCSVPVSEALKAEELTLLGPLWFVQTGKKRDDTIGLNGSVLADVEVSLLGLRPRK